MQKRQPPKLQPRQGPVLTKRLQFICNDQNRLAIPVGPHFQAVVPEWTGPSSKEHHPGNDIDSSTSKWLGTQVWPIKGRGRKSNRDAIGRGRPDFCPCAYPGSEECIRRHVSDKRVQLQMDIGPAFWKWKFNEMGEEVSKLWSLEEEKKFEFLVKMNPRSQDKSFLKPMLENLPRRRRESIVSYFFNVYVPRCISMKTRSGCKIIDTDDEDDGEGLTSKSSRKRCKADGIPSYSSKYVKIRYLTGRR